MMRKWNLKEVVGTIGSMLMMAAMAVLLLAFWMSLGLVIYCCVT